MCRNQGDPYAGMVRCMGVRAFIVAKKSRNGDGAKGGRKIDGRNPDTTKERLAIMEKQRPKQAREANDRWSWVERCVWTDSMLTALEEGVKGGKSAYFRGLGLLTMTEVHKFLFQSLPRY
jgi:hypothetical protein